MKKRKKRYVKDSKNYTIYVVDFCGEKWSGAELFGALYFKYNQYLIGARETILRISKMDDRGYEYSTYLLSDLIKDTPTDSMKTILRLQDEIKETIKHYKDMEKED